MKTYKKVIKHLVSGTIVALYNEEGEILKEELVSTPGQVEIIYYPMGLNLEELTRRIEREQNERTVPEPEAAFPERER